MTDTFEIDVGGVSLLFFNIAGAIDSSPELMREIGSYLVYSILDRTAKGKDMEGMAFMPYSASHASVRESVGLPTNVVDLFFGGSMLSALTYEETGTSVKLFFMDTPHVDHVTVPGRKKKASRASNAEIAFYNDEIRPFFAMSAEEQEEVMQIVNDYIEDAFRRGGHG